MFLGLGGAGLRGLYWTWSSNVFLSLQLQSESGFVWCELYSLVYTVTK